MEIRFDAAEMFLRFRNLSFFNSLALVLLFSRFSSSSGGVPGVDSFSQVLEKARYLGIRWTKRCLLLGEHAV